MVLKDKLDKEQIRNVYKLPDKLVLHFQHYAALGRPLNLNNPKRFTDKIQWYKLNYRNPLMTICADKFRIREYLEEKGFLNYMPELYQVCDTFEQIKFKYLPPSFVIKSNNGSGTNIFIQNKENINMEDIKRTVDSWEEVNTLSIGREWAYKNIEPKIVIEELLEPQDEFQSKYGLNDYKFLCFHGEPKYIWVDIKRFRDHKRSFYDLKWKQIDIEYVVPKINTKLPRPNQFNKMVEIATVIANDFPFARVDFYELNGKLYIGEITFYPDSGIGKFTPDEFDYELGKLFDISRIKYE